MASNLRHEIYGKRLYNIWGGMKDRCNNKNGRDYSNYGGRGIRICDEWLSDFNSFYDWAINNGYAEKLTIDRIDVDGNYEPNNCRWITIQEQNLNRRDTLHITIDGVTKTTREWEIEYDLNKSTIINRLRYGYTGKDLLQKQIINKNQILDEVKAMEIIYKLNNGIKPKHIIKEYGISRSSLYDIKYGRTWSHVTGIKKV